MPASVRALSSDSSGSWAQRFSALVPDCPALQNCRTVLCLSGLTVTCNRIHNAIRCLAQDLDLAFPDQFWRHYLDKY